MSLVERLIYELGPWNWWVLGLLLLGLEVVVPGTIFLWFGIAAILVGTLALVVDLSWQVALGLFLVLSLVSLFVGRRLMNRTGRTEGDPNLNRRGSRYIGRVFILERPLEQGSGHLSIDDTVWRVTGPDLPAGARVRIERIEGAQLVVSDADASA
ncbi:NfeD family protein [Polymorphum gilvum]|uniref:Nodulation efficiency protein D n=1 Tax=Polymorphum gilvum (strain LMG 25793 / CGMCC 1.9160 / SL003B-26A1) TaxID=991905 RepID=F2IWH1_POLGS|nr:NfeD family protein [Polymorphum gilvum]ADZ69270.1 Nodulation efficiency protein D [Polymorphum gilvum SL003B-26A1]